MAVAVLIWIGIIIAVVLGSGAVIFALTDKRLKVVKSAVPAQKRRPAALTALLAVAGILVAGGGAFGAYAKSTAHSSPRPTSVGITAHFTSPLVTPNDPVPMVPMRMTVYVTAHLNGEVLIIGNATTKNPVITFQSSSPAAASNSWSAYATFGDIENGGCIFNLWAMAMPQSLETYLLDESLAYQPDQQSYWMSYGLPPMPPTTILDHITVQRGPCQVNTKCSC